MKYLHYSWSLLQWYGGREQQNQYFFQFLDFFLFEKPVLILENVSDKMPYPKQPIILFMCLIFETNKNSDTLTKTKIKTRNAFKELI